MPPREPVPGFVCSRTWESLTPTRRPGVRRCDACHQDVHLTHDAEGVWRLARTGQCVAYSVTKTLGLFLPSADPVPLVAWFVAPTTGATFQLRDGAVIGSAPTADLAIDDPTIATAHGRIERTASGFALVAIEPAEVVVNGARARRVELVDGDQLRLGATQLIFKSTA